MPGQPGFFDRDERYAALSAVDPPERLAVVDFELFRDELDAALDRADRTRGGRPLMFKVLILQTLYTLSDGQTEYQIRNRLSFMLPTAAGPSSAPQAIGSTQRVARARAKRARHPVFGYKNHLGIDRRHGFILTFAVTDGAASDGRQLGKLLDRHNTASPGWADSAYRSAANVALLARRGLVPHLQRPKPRGRPMPPHLVRGNAGRARVRVAIEHVFAAQEWPARSGHPLDRPRPRHHQARARQSGHQHAPPSWGFRTRCSGVSLEPGGG